MIKIVTVEQMRQIEAKADANGISYATMMENAGRATAEQAQGMLVGIDNPKVTLLIGPGNNGGDGLVAAHYLSQHPNITVRLYLLKRRDDDNFKRVAHLFIAYAEDDHDGRLLRQAVASADLIIDALFGIGVRLPLKDTAARILRGVKQALNTQKTSYPAEWTIYPTRPDKMPQIASPRVLAVDCPSGLDCNTGEIDRHTIHADATITFIAAKPGLFSFPGAAYVGELSIATIGVPDDFLSTIKLATAQGIKELLPPRPINSHKGSYGKVAILGGSSNYMGAVVLAAEAAYRAGAGLVAISASADIMPILATHLKEAIWKQNILDHLQSYNSLLVGPGWGQSDEKAQLLHKLLTQKTMLSSLVIDADGLNLLSQVQNWWDALPANTILTPHPGEMSRLSELPIQEIQANRYQVAHEKAKEWQVILMLKGAHTIIATPTGDICVLPFKTDALATAGTGDILAGLIAGMLAQGAKPFEAAVAAGYVHGLAGELLPNGRASTAGDVLANIPKALSIIEHC